MSSTTRVGLRARIASSAPSLLAASRVWYPSSFRMPAISMRMSASSSTIKMSCAMKLTQPRSSGDARARACAGFGCEDQLHRRTASGAVVQYQIAAVILHDFLDDRETETGSFGSRRDVGLGQPMPLILGQ